MEKSRVSIMIIAWLWTLFSNIFSHFLKNYSIYWCVFKNFFVSWNEITKQALSFTSKQFSTVLLLFLVFFINFFFIWWTHLFHTFWFQNWYQIKRKFIINIWFLIKLFRSHIITKLLLKSIKTFYSLFWKKKWIWFEIEFCFSIQIYLFSLKVKTAITDASDSFY